MDNWFNGENITYEMLSNEIKQFISIESWTGWIYVQVRFKRHENLSIDAPCWNEIIIVVWWISIIYANIERAEWSLEW